MGSWDHLPQIKWSNLYVFLRLLVVVPSVSLHEGFKVGSGSGLGLVLQGEGRGQD